MIRKRIIDPKAIAKLSAIDLTTDEITIDYLARLARLARACRYLEL